MSRFHDERDSIDAVIADAQGRDHTPHSVSDSAIAELRRRGYDEQTIQILVNAPPIRL